MEGLEKKGYIVKQSNEDVKSADNKWYLTYRLSGHLL
jgi:hypothetical protein